jgi:hypothetical protein
LEKQGVVTVRKGGNVAIKIVAGTQGTRALALALAIAYRGGVPDVETAYNLALSTGFGKEADLVVLDAGRALYRGVGELDEQFRKTFTRARFNPRQSVGAADNICLVDF